MNEQEGQHLIDTYVEWFRKGLSVKSLGDNTYELTTPFLDRHGDHLQVYVVRRNGTIMLSDDGYTLSDLRANGVDLSTPRRKAALGYMLRGFEVRVKEEELVIEASEHNLGQQLHSLAQAMLAANNIPSVAQAGIDWVGL